MRMRDAFTIECSDCFCAVEVPVHDVNNGVLTCPRCGACNEINWPTDWDPTHA